MAKQTAEPNRASQGRNRYAVLDKEAANQRIAELSAQFPTVHPDIIRTVYDTQDGEMDRVVASLQETSNQFATFETASAP